MVTAVILMLSVVTQQSVKASLNYTEEQVTMPSLTKEEIQGLNIQIKYYIEPEANKEDLKKLALLKYNDAMKLIEDFSLKIGTNINSDIDDIGYQIFVKRLGTNFDLFSKEEIEKIIEFVKFIDLYENIDKNNRIRAYENKLNNLGLLSSDDLADLISILPVVAFESTHNSITGTSIENDQSLSSYTNGYNPTVARDYAYRWWNSRNNTEFPYYKNYYGCDACWNDCTNFVSQALYKGGALFWKGLFLTGDNAWYYEDGFMQKPSHSWGGAHNFYNHWRKRADLAAYDTDLKVGDPVNADFTGDGDIDHTALITKIENGKRLLTQHTTDRKDAPLQKWYDARYVVYGWKMDTARKTPND